jgi:heme A synthase
VNDVFQSRLYSSALVLAALATLAAIIYLSIVGKEVNDYLAGLAGLTPMQANLGKVQATIRQPADEPVPVRDVEV